jgi:hypothetical protein
MAKRIRASDRHRWTERDGRLAVLAAILLVFVAAASLSDGRLLSDFSAWHAPATRAGPDPADTLRTGSILITPAQGNICEHRIIDNETWRIRPGGHIACDDALKWQAERNGAYTPQTRLEAIRDGFFSKR